MAPTYARLGRSSLKVSPLCLGTLMFGEFCSDQDADRIVGMARDSGINFVDTADTYSEGRSEIVLGRLIARDRDAWVLSSKVGNPGGVGPMKEGLGRRWLTRQVEGSLRRLGTEALDILYLHRPDPDTPLPETLTTVRDMIRAGKVLHWGFTNFRGWQVAELVRVADQVGLERPVACQAYYNLVNRLPETELLPACEHFGIGVAAFSPLARGVLTGKYRPDVAPPDGSRASRHDERLMETEFRPDVMKVARRMAEHAAARGMPAISFALRWLLNNALVTTIVAGPRTPSQWQGYLDCLVHGFDPLDEALVDSWVPPGQMATPGGSDLRYPPTGRRLLRQPIPPERSDDAQPV